MIRSKVPLFTISIFLVIIWFRKGLMIAAGESGTPFYFASRLFDLTRWAWYENVLGFPAPQIVTSSPLYLLSSTLDKIGISSWLLQGSVWLLLMLVGAFSVHSIVLKLVQPENGVQSYAPVIAGAFYILNPVSMTLVWHRFQLTFLFLYALLPLSLLLAIHGLEQRRYLYGSLIGLISALLSYAFGSASSLGVLWLVLLSYFIYHLATRLRQRSDVFFALKFLIVTVVCWIMFNAWWLLTFLYSSPSILAEATTQAADLASMISVSEHSGPLYTLRLVHWYYTYVETTWGSIFSSLPLELVASVVPIVVFSTILLKRKSRYVIYFIMLALLLSFLAMGAASPFGDVFTWLFTNIPYFQVFRNPGEKFGLALPLAYSPLFGVGLASLYRWLEHKLRYVRWFGRSAPNAGRLVGWLLTSSIAFSIMGLYVWPMWTGTVFTSPYVPADNPEIGYYVSVPSYYENARHWLAKDHDLYRVIVLPITGEGITYTWEYGYVGVELSNHLLGKESVSLGQGMSYTDKIILNLDRLLISTPNFWKVMALLNTKYVVVRSDINHTLPYRAMSSPSTIADALVYIVQPSISGGLIDEASDATTSVLPSTLDKPDIRVVWANSSLPYSLGLSNETMQSSYTMTLKAYSAYFPQSNSSHLGFYYFPHSELVDFSDGRYLELWIRSNEATKLYIEVDDSEGRAVAWDGRLDGEYQIGEHELGSWKLLVLPLAAPSMGKGTDLKDIERILIATSTPGRSAYTEIHVGGIFVDSGVRVVQNYIDREVAFGALDFYRVDVEHYLPRVYALVQLGTAKDIDEFLFTSLQSEEYDPRDTVVFLESQSQINDLSFLSGIRLADDPPPITIQRADPTKYLVHVEDAQEPFIMVFSETYHPEWKAYYGDVDWIQAFYSEPIPDNQHLIANGYANAWYIDKAGSYVVTLYFWPQSLGYLGLAVSIPAFLVYGVILVMIKRSSLSPKAG